MESWGENSEETERLGTGMRCGRMEVENWEGVERDLRRPGRTLETMGKGWDDMGEKR